MFLVLVNARAATPAPGSPAEVTALAAAVGLGNVQANHLLWQGCCVVAQRVARRWARGGVDADDLSQEALLRAVESFKGLRNPAALHSWLQVIVTRSIARRVRIMRRKGQLTAHGSDPEGLASHEAPPDFQVDVNRLLDTLGSLPEEERRCFWLRHGEGRCIEEIARETALSPSTIHRRLNVAERRLAKRLREPTGIAADA